MSLRELIAECDGGARGNPGPAAIGVSILTPAGEEIDAIGETIGVATNNVAEYRAALRALQRCTELGARVVHLRSDSQLLVRQLTGEYKIKHANLRPLAIAVHEAARAFEQVTYEHVPRARNARADALVNEALDATGAPGRTWPDDWDERMRGKGCPICASLELTEDEFGIRFHETPHTVAKLQKRSPLRGYSLVIWRGSHVAEPHELDEDDLAAYWRDVVRVGRTLLAHFGGCKVNYETLGNSVPHLHTHVLVRYLDDPWPDGPVDLLALTDQPLDELRADAGTLRALLGG